MKVFLVTRKRTGWCEDYAMVIIAEDARHAERRARIYSDNFRKDKTVEVTEVSTDKEQILLVANTGA